MKLTEKKKEIGNLKKITENNKKFLKNLIDKGKHENERISLENEYYNEKMNKMTNNIMELNNR